MVSGSQCFGKAYIFGYGRDEGGTPSGIQSAAYQWVTDNSKKPVTGMVNLDAAAVAAGEYTISLSDYYGTCYLYYKVTDRKGNIQDGFSGQIKKDDVHHLEFTGPDKAQLLSAGLPMSISLTYGPSGGKLTGTVQTEVLAELPVLSGNLPFIRAEKETSGLHGKKHRHKADPIL